MSGFDKREKSYEAKFAHDQETNFKIHARRNKLLGLWVAEKLGMSGGDAEAYAKEVIKSDFAEPGDEDVYRKIAADLEAKGADISEHRLRRQMADFLDQARDEVVSEG